MRQRSADLGFTVRTGVGGTGVLADLDSGRPGPTLMLRADMDALPIVERGEGRVVTSGVDGVMHACGHDGHVAMTLGAATALVALRDGWSGRVRLCFQPAEETASGAMPMIDDGAADGVDRVLGIHLWAPLETGRVAVKSGVIFGSADSFSLTIQGRGGHGGMPHTAIDPVVVTAQVILAIQTIISRETSPFSPAVITIGRVTAGTAFNVIAESAELLGTTRAIEASERERLLKRVAEIATAVASGYGAEAHFVRGSGCPPVVCDTATADARPSRRRGHGRRGTRRHRGADHGRRRCRVLSRTRARLLLSRRRRPSRTRPGAAASQRLLRHRRGRAAGRGRDPGARQPGRARLMDFIRSREDRNDLYSTVDLTPRPTSESETLLSVAMEIEHANNSGYVHGGTIMRLVDTAAGIAAVKHARRRVVTATMDEMSFLAPVYIGDLLTVHARVNDAHHTSMEISVRVDVERIPSGEKLHVASAHLVYVGLDREGRPAEVAKVIAVTEEERRRQAEARVRREQRLLRKRALAEALRGDR